MSARGIDFLGRRSWLGAATKDSPVKADALSTDLPSILLPMTNREMPISGMAADRHRRGRGLPFPSEAQVPVHGVAENQAGRVLLAAAFERLARAEMSWGQLNDTRLSWRPDGNSVVQIDAAKAIIHALQDGTSDGDSVGLVVPDALGVAGQQTILNYVRNRSLILVPRSVAVAIDWCNHSGARSVLAGPCDEFAGFLTVCDLSLGRWSVVLIPIFRERVRGVPTLTPAHFPSMKRTSLVTSGMGILAEQGAREFHDFLQPLAADPWLTGTKPLSFDDRISRQQRTALFPSLRDLEGRDSLNEGLAEIRLRFRELAAPAEWGPCLGVIVTGALSGAVADGKPLPHWIGQLLSLPIHSSTEHAAARGAALAALGLETGLPTWLEMVEKLELHYIGRDDFGVRKSSWKEILKPQLVRAGTVYRNENPITGLKLKAGQNSVQITIRRPDERGEFIFRRVQSAPGKTNESEIQLLINVVARPGQGFAVVKVESRESGEFESHLDWHKMEECEEPQLRELGYIQSAIEIIPDSTLWERAKTDVTFLYYSLRSKADAHQIERAAREASQRIGRLVSPLAEPGKYVPISSHFKFHRALGRHGEAPTDAGNEILDRIKTTGLEWLASHPPYLGAHKWLRRYFGFSHLGCPRGIVQEALNRLTTLPKASSAEDLHIAGCCLDRPEELRKFYAAYLVAMPSSTASTPWLRAFRNTIKFNGHALRDVESSFAHDLFTATLERLKKSIEGNRPGIAQNSMEALLFSLNRRQTDGSFASVGSSLFIRASLVLQELDHSEILRRRSGPKLRELKSTLLRFLREEGNVNDLATLLEDDEDSSGEE